MSNNNYLFDVLRRLEIAERNIAEARGALNSLMAHQPQQPPTTQPVAQAAAAHSTNMPTAPSAPIGGVAANPPVAGAIPRPGLQQAPQPVATPQQPVAYQGAPQQQPVTYLGAAQQPPTLAPQGFKKPVENTQPWWTNDKIVNRLLGIFGGLVTFVGVAFLVTLGIEHGIIGPPAQVGFALVLGVAIFAGAARLQRTKGQQAIIIALLTTSLLVLGATNMSVGFVLEWISDIGTTILFAFLGIVFIAIAYMWNIKHALTTVASGWYFLALWHTTETSTSMYWTYSFMGIILCVLGLKKNWQDTAMVGTVMSLVFAILFDNFADFAINLDYIFLVCAVIYMAANYIFPTTPARIGTVGFFVLACAKSWDNPGYPSSALTDVLIIMWVTFALSCAWIYLKGEHYAWAFIPIHVFALSVWGADFSIAGIPGETFISIVYILMLAFVVAQFKNTPKTLWIWHLWLVLLLPHVIYPLTNTLVRDPQSIVDGRESLVGIALGILVAFSIYARERLPKPTLLFGIIALVMTMVSTVTITTTLGHAIAEYTGMWLGYLAGHSLVSIAWILIAAWLILGRYTSLGVGVSLAIAGTVKLVFLDMSNLHGLPRVLAFIVSGVILIVVATKQGKAVKQTKAVDASASTQFPTNAQPQPAAASAPTQPTATPHAPAPSDSPATTPPNTPESDV